MKSRAEYNRAYRERQKTTLEYVVNKQQRASKQKEYRQQKKELFDALINVAYAALEVAQANGLSRLETMALLALTNAGKLDDN
jgi:HD-like signal output (HDOD) protein